MVKKLLLSVLGCLLALFSTGCTGCNRSPAQAPLPEGSPASSPEPAGKLFALRYGISRFPASQIFANPGTEYQLPFHWLFFLVDLPGKVLLVDTGFTDPGYIPRFGIEYTAPRAILEELGYNPGQVTDIILTHTHFDHIGGVRDYPNATLHLFRVEYEQFLRQPGNASLKTYLQQHPALKLYTGDYKPAPGITVHKAGGHTSGSAVVYITLNGETVVLTGDEAYLEENVHRVAPIGAYADLEANRNFLEELHTGGLPFYTFHSPKIVTGEQPWQRLR